MPRPGAFSLMRKRGGADERFVEQDRARRISERGVQLGYCAVLAGLLVLPAVFLGAEPLGALLGAATLLLGSAAVVASAIGFSGRGARRRAGLGITLAVLAVAVPAGLTLRVILAIASGGG